MKFLLIDDEPDDRELAKKYLKEEFPDAEFIEIFSQKQFYEAIEQDFDAAITDYRLHWTNGIKVLMEIKKRKPFAPVIMLTGTGTEEVAVEAMKRGLDDYVLKTPERFVRLPAAVRAAMQKEEMWKREKMLSTIVENAREAVVSVDSKGNIIYANRATEEIFGWKKEELIGNHMNIMAVDKERQREEFERAIKENGIRFETVRRDRYGNEIPVLMTVIPFKDEKGNLLFASATMVDIRDLKENERRIKHLNELLRAIRNINQLITREKDKDKLLEKACKILTEVRGYEAVCICTEDQMYISGEKRVCNEMIEFVKSKGIEGQLEEGTEKIFEFDGKHIFAILLSKNELSIFLYVIYSRKFDKEEVELLKEVGTDIVFALRSIEVEEALKEEEQLTKAILSASPVGIGYTVNRILGWANDAMYRMTGYTPEETLGKSAGILYESDEEYERVGREMEKAFKEGKIAEILTKWKRKDGSTFDCFIRAYPLNPEDLKEGVVVVAMDVTEKRRLEKELMESEEKYRMLIETSPDAIILHKNGEILYVNPATVKFFGAKSDKELIGKSLLDFAHPDLKKKAPEMLQEFKEKGRIYIPDGKFVRLDGEIVYGEIIGTVTVYKGEPALQVVIRDVTQRKKMEEALRESEEKYRVLADNAPAGVFILYGKEIIYINKMAEEMLRREKDARELYKKWRKEGKININDFLLLWREEKRRQIMNILEQGVKGKKATVELETASGRYLLFTITTIKYKGKDALLGIVQDITEIREAERKIIESEKRFRSLVANAHDAIYIITPQGFKYVNPAFEELTGYSREELLSKEFDFTKLIHPEDLSMILEREEARKRGEKIPSRYEFRIVRKDGSIRVVEAATVDIGEDKEVRVLGILRDITERRRAEEEVRKLSHLHRAIGMSINQSENIKELCEGLLNEIREILDIEYANIFIYDKKRQKLVPSAYVGYPEELAKVLIKEYDIGMKQPWISVKVFIDRKEKYIKNVQQYKPLSFSQELYKKYGIKELFSIPLIIKGEIRGVLQVAATAKNPLLPEKRRLLKSIAEEIAAGIAKIEAEERMKEALEKEREFKLRTAHYFFNPICIARGFLELALEEEDGKDKILKAIEAIKRVEKVVKNITKRGEIRE